MNDFNQLAALCHGETVNGQNCRIISLGTDHETHFVQEIYYAVSCDTIYTYDQINDEWLELGSEEKPGGPPYGLCGAESPCQRTLTTET